MQRFTGSASHLARQGVLRDTDEERALQWVHSMAQQSDANFDGELTVDEFRRCLQMMDINGCAAGAGRRAYSSPR